MRSEAAQLRPGEFDFSSYVLMGLVLEAGTCGPVSMPLVDARRGDFQYLVYGGEIDVVLY